MTKMEKKEEEKIIKENPHLQTYLDELRKKIERPIFYSKLPRDLKEEKYPNIIYPTKGCCVHSYIPDQGYGRKGISCDRTKSK